MICVSSRFPLCPRPPACRTMVCAANAVRAVSESAERWTGDSISRMTDSKGGLNCASACAIDTSGLSRPVT